MDDLILTKHATQRLSQRGIHADDIHLAIDWGLLTRKQGMQFYILTKKRIPKYVAPKHRHRLQNLVVVVGTDKDSPKPVIITAYKNDKAIRKIKKKSTVLL